MHSSVAKLPVSPEEQALEALSEGNLRHALTLLMDCYGEELYRHCRQMLGSDALAADVHQTVFVQAFGDLPSFARRSSLRTWLYAIARHRCLDALKMQRRRRWRFLQGASTEERADPRPTADQSLQEFSRSQAMTRALQCLKPEVRLAVLLRYREEMSYEQMSEVCGAAPATLQARVQRALPKLKKALQAEEDQL